jgi:hypothetical protein
MLEHLLIHLLLQDTQLVIERYKSGFLPPEDIQFEDLNQPRQSVDQSNTLPSIPAIVAASTVKGTLSAGKHKKRVGLFGIFGSNKVGSSFVSGIFIRSLHVLNSSGTVRAGSGLTWEILTCSAFTHVNTTCSWSRWM